MFPVLFSTGNLSVSSYGVFLALGFLFGVFLVWRLARAWDLDEEKILDMTLLTFLGGMVGARIYFAIENWSLFASAPLNLILFNKTPGFSFWGGFLGGWLTLFLFARHKKLDFWQLGDIASVGLLGGLILSEVGCFLGGCNVGIPSKVFFAVTQVGILGKRWPVQLFEVGLLSLILLKVWGKATHFHQRGMIVSLTLILAGGAKLVLEPIRQNHSGMIFSVILILLGLVIFYRITKKNPLMQAKELEVFVFKLLSDPKMRDLVVQKTGRYWYNQKVGIGWKLRDLKKILRRFNVKLS